MASSSPPVRPARYLSLFLLLLIGLYLLIFLTGDKQAKPKLGIDLQGGTRVTLTARTPDGSRPTSAALNQAQQIISARVNGLGVSGSEVVIDGDNLVITVPGSDGNQARSLGQTARLFIRPVVPDGVIAVPEQGEQPPGGIPGMPGTIPGMPGETPSVPGAPVPGMPDTGAPDTGVPATGAPAPAAPTAPPAPQPRPYPEDPPSPTPSPAPPTPVSATPTSGAPTPAAPASPAPAPAPGAPTSAAPAPAPGEPTSAAPAPAPGAPLPPAPDPRKDLADSIAFQKQLRQTPALAQVAVSVLMEQRCQGSDPLAGNDDPTLPLVTCSSDHKAIYVLDKSIISGDQIDTASASFDQQHNQWVVNLKFKSDASDVWGDFTAKNVGTQTAFTLDSQVVSAPAIREAIPGGNTQITGNFTAAKARDLANVLKYGSLPLSFESSEAETVSATLGLTSLKAGLIAGAIGLVIVLIYSLLYYRALGILTALSLVASGAMVYAILILLGRYINYTLDLAGIAGLIIGIGTTADSFVVFFERIKDEIREGRSFRSAVPRGWVRARKTILSGNAVSFLAAAVLYFLAIGQVKGFAFTLGLTTILDTVVVFLVTWPLVYLASKSPTLAKPAFNGLGAVQQIARERRAAAYATGQR
ncbi:MAG: protein translocase subunit SecD [Mycobacteriaceae bacterium]|nr:protein translocase subunit SecD [Mycobacteriaceae bacterium]